MTDTPTTATKTISRLNKIMEYVYKTMLVLILICAFISFGWLTILTRECQSFWGEQCTIVAAPSSVQPMFHKQWYEEYNQEVKDMEAHPAPASTTE